MKHHFENIANKAKIETCNDNEFKNIEIVNHRISCLNSHVWPFFRQAKHTQPQLYLSGLKNLSERGMLKDNCLSQIVFFYEGNFKLGSIQEVYRIIR